MSNYSSLKATIDANVRTNNNQEITGAIMNSVLNAVVTSIGAKYQYAGVATPTTNPNSPDQNLFYIATTPGTYTYFSNIVVAAGECVVLKGTGTSWTKEDTGIDLVSVSQNSQTGHTDINIGSDSYPVASVEEVSQLGQEVVLLNFPSFLISEQSARVLHFSANPYILYKNKQLRLFADEDNLILDLSNVFNPIAYIPYPVLESLGLNGTIGVSNITIANWTVPTNIKNALVLCVYVGDTLQQECGLFAPHLLNQFVNQQAKIQKNNSFIQGFPSFSMSINGVDIVFSANPIINYNGKQLYLFADEDNLTIHPGIDNCIVSIQNSILNSLPLGSKIGLSRFTISNWTDGYSTKDHTILYMGVNGSIPKEAGILSPWFISSKIGELELKPIEYNATLLDFPDFSITETSERVLTFSANPWLLYRNKTLQLFADGDSLTLDMHSVYNPVVYIPYSVLDGLSNGAKIGVSNIIIGNWTTPQNIQNSVVLCVYSGGRLMRESGLLAPFFASQKIGTLEESVSDLSNKVLGVANPSLLDYSKTLDIIKPFLAKFRNKNQDVNIVINGDSISEHPQTYGTTEEYKRNPPLLARYNLASLLFQFVRWPGQEYRRADDSEYIFSETGTWNTANSAITALDDWDDSDNSTGLGYRGGFTRYSGKDGANSIGFVVPIGAWAFHFIYRTDIYGGDMIVSVSEGNGKLQVFDGTNWVEANGYHFSTLQVADYANGVGNTAYQKRLKFRTFDKNGTMDSRDAQKIITISKAQNNTRLCYWGVEWSSAEFMINVINSSRGSQDLVEMGQTIKTELYDRDPALFLFQVPLINMGIVPEANGYTPEQQLQAVRSFLSGVKTNSNNWVDYQCVLFLPNTYMYAQPWVDGTNEYRMVYNQNAKKTISVKDFYDVFSAEYFDGDEVGFVNTFNAFMAEILVYFSLYSQGLAASSPLGNTFTDDGTHPNHRGVDTYFKYMKPLFEN